MRVGSSECPETAYSMLVEDCEGTLEPLAAAYEPRNFLTAAPVRAGEVVEK